MWTNTSKDQIPSTEFVATDAISRPFPISNLALRNLAKRFRHSSTHTWEISTPINEPVLVTKNSVHRPAPGPISTTVPHLLKYGSIKFLTTESFHSGLIVHSSPLPLQSQFSQTNLFAMRLLMPGRFFSGAAHPPSLTRTLP